MVRMIRAILTLSSQRYRHRLGEAQGVRLVDFNLGVHDGLVAHHQIKHFLGQPFEQREAIAFTCWMIALVIVR